MSKTIELLTNKKKNLWKPFKIWAVCFAIDVTERYKEVLNQMFFSMYLFWWYSEKSLVAELTFGMAAHYIK